MHDYKQPHNIYNEEDIVINYAIHTHPMTQLKTPDLFD